MVRSAKQEAIAVVAARAQAAESPKPVPREVPEQDAYSTPKPIAPYPKLVTTDR